jgi:hypothetical protein
MGLFLSTTTISGWKSERQNLVEQQDRLAPMALWVQLVPLVRKATEVFKVLQDQQVLLVQSLLVQLVRKVWAHRQGVPMTRTQNLLWALVQQLAQSETSG